MKITTKTIRDLTPCSDGLDNFLEHSPNFDGTHEDFLSLEYVSHEHKLWVILRLMPRFEVEVFAIDCAIAAHATYAVHAAIYAANAAAEAATAAAYYKAYYAANAAYAADEAANAADAAANAASYAADAAANAANAANAAYASYYAANAAYAATCAAYYAATCAASYAATYAAERERQLDAICYLINKSEE